MVKVFVYLILFTLIIGCANTVKPIQPTKQVEIEIPKIETASPEDEPVTLYQEVDWLEFENATFIKAKIKQRFIVAYFWEEGCSYCSAMESTTFVNQDIISLLNDNFVPMRVRGEEHPEAVSALLGEPIFPSTVIMSPQGIHVITIYGYLSPGEYLKVLTTIMEASS